MPSVGLIGIGRIGTRLAVNMLAKGYSVTGCDIVAKPEFVAAGGVQVATPREVAGATEVVLLSLVGPETLAVVIDGPDGLLGRAGSGQIIADLSAMPLAAKARARDLLAKNGAVYLDCQITGSPEMLVDRRGVIFASGDRAAAARCEPVFAAAVAKNFYVGDFGAATKLKTANNLLVALHTLAAAEAMGIATRSGIDPKLAIEIMGSGAGTSQAFIQRAPLMAGRNYPNTSARMESFEVFLDLIDTALAETKVNAPLARAAVALYRRALKEGFGDQEMSSIYELVLNEAGKTGDTGRG